MERISELKILKGVPFEKDTNTSMTFDSLSDQTSYFSSFAIKTFTNLSFVKGFLYKKVRLQCDIDEVYNANYIMWKNNDGKWFYAYITGFEFVSELATEISFDMDYIQSYMGDIVFDNCDIEREHTNDDEIYEKLGENSVDPIIKKEDYIIDTTETDFTTNWKVAVYYKPNLFLKGLESDPSSSWANTTQGGTINMKDAVVVKKKSEYTTEAGETLSVNDKLYSGADVKYFNCSNDAERRAIQDQITEWEITGYHIIDIIMIPKNAQENEIAKEITIELSQSPYWTSDNIGGYHPMNKLLYCYPFLKLQVSNMQGNTRDYRYEYFLKTRQGSDKPIHTISFRKLRNLLGGVIENLIPIGYNDARATTISTMDRTSYDYGISNQVSPKCIWNENSFVVNLVKGAISTVVGAGAMMAGMMMTGTPITSMSFKPNPNLPSEMTQQILDNEQDTKGNQTTNATSQLIFNTFGFMFKRMCYNKIKLQEYDIAFSMYGYYYEHTIKTPNIVGRSRFNYVKTRNARISGNIPIIARQDIIEKLNNGYTFWHDKTITNYGNLQGIYANDIIIKTLTNRGTIF